jgi:hypothetical protein
MSITPSVSISRTPSPSATPIVYSATVYVQDNVDYPYGWVDASTACSQGGYSGYSYTVYYTGTLGNGTVLYNDTARTSEFFTSGNYGYYKIGSYSFSVSGFTIANYTVCPTGYNISWSYTKTGGGSAVLSISVNSTQVVYQASGTSSSGNFTIQPGDYITCDLYGTSGNYSQSELYIYQGSTLLDSSVGCALSDSSATLPANYLGGNGSIIAIVSNGLGGCP